MKKTGGIQPPAVATVPEIEAVRSCISGTANGDQQKLAMEWIMREASRVTDLSYTPGDPNATMFAEGRRYAGICIRYCLLPEYLEEARQLEKQRQK